MSKLAALNREIKKVDRDLVAKKTDTGKIDIFYKETLWESYSYKECKLVYSRPILKWAASLTHNWTYEGQPVDWGIDFVVNRLNEIRREQFEMWFDDMVKKRESDKRSKEQSRRNEFRALAADARREFAQATNDINTSSLSKGDNHGYL